MTKSTTFNPPVEFLITCTSSGEFEKAMIFQCRENGTFIRQFQNTTRLSSSSTAVALVDIQTESKLQHEISLYVTLSACLQIARPHWWCFEVSM